MAVTGLNLFIERFAPFRASFVLIGGAACDVLFTSRNLRFRATRDLDLVIVLEKLNPQFIRAFREFIIEGNYQSRQKSDGGPPELFRFENPVRNNFPAQLEFLCPRPVELDLGPDQHIIPVRMDDAPSLSAILLNKAYYDFLLAHCQLSGGIQSAEASALIPLKVRAWLDLGGRRARGEAIRGKEVDKHRADVFRLALTLPATPTIRLPGELARDIELFLAKNPPDHPDWEAILQSIRNTMGVAVSKEDLIDTIKSYFTLTNS